MIKATFKFNSGMGALLCEKCRTIIKVGSEFTPTEWAALRGEVHLDPQLCNECAKLSVTE